MCPPKHNPAKPHCSLNPEASPTKLSEETPYNWRCVSMHVHGMPQESLDHDRKKTYRPAKLSPIPDNSGPIVNHLMGLPVQPAATQPGIEPRSVVMPQALQCLRALCPFGRPVQCMINIIHCFSFNDSIFCTKTDESQICSEASSTAVP
jgi:hypothetical protein